MSVPRETREQVVRRLWEEADRLGWIHLPSSEKSRRFEEWTRDPDVGGVLSRFMDVRRVRVYIKDTLMKPYAQSRLASEDRPYRVAGISGQCVAEEYVKPHGRRLMDGRIVCWGRAADWKGVLMALFERTASLSASTPAAAILVDANGRYSERRFRSLVEEAASRLGVQQVVWLED